jgi:hypothetical protein
VRNGIAAACVLFAGRQREFRRLSGSGCFERQEKENECFMTLIYTYNFHPRGQDIDRNGMA